MLLKLLTKKKNIKLRILNHLYDNQDNVTGIARAIGSQKANVSKAIRQLRDDDLVRKEIIGRSHRYKLNLLNPSVMELIRIIIRERGDEFNAKLNCLPKLMDSYLSALLTDNYQGCIFFGSALTDKYKDIDVFVIVRNLKNKEKAVKKIKSVDPKISPLFGTRKELEAGLANQDMLYMNIINGLPFSCLDFIISLRHKNYLLRRKDVEERFIMGYREIQSCREFEEDRIYLKHHLKKGIMDMTYAVLNYLESYPKNDYEAIRSFKENIKMPVNYTDINKAENLAKKLWKVVFD